MMMMMMRKVALWIGVAVVLGWGSGASAVPIEWTVASGGNGHFYEVVTTQMSWDAGRAYAESQGGYLATIRYASEQQFIIDHIMAVQSVPYDAVKLGGYQDTSSPDFSEPDGGWQWVTGEEWSYTNWSPGEPNDCCPVGENYLSLHHVASGSNAYSWNDNVSLSHVPLLIEYGTPGEPIPEPSTALLLGIGLSALAATRRKRSRSADGPVLFS